MSNTEVQVIDQMLGKTFTTVSIGEDAGDKVELLFMNELEMFKFYHNQECCESVFIDDIVGDLEDLVNNPILTAEFVTQEGETEDRDTYLWTFYKFATIKGSVTVKWYGTSNGYYSERVDVKRIDRPKGETFSIDEIIF